MVDATISRPGCAVWRVWAAQVPAGTPLTRRAPRARALHAVSRSPVQTGIGKRLPARPRRPAHAPSVRSHGINHLAYAPPNTPFDRWSAGAGAHTLLAHDQHTKRGALRTHRAPAPGRRADRPRLLQRGGRASARHL